MSLYISIKQLLIKPISRWKKRIIRFNLAANSKNEALRFIKENRFPELTRDERQKAKNYWRSKGFKLDNTLWHQYYKGVTGEFCEQNIPEDIFRAIIAPRLNQMRQWPALLDKNLAYDLFRNCNHPKLVISNINGFYYHNNNIINQFEAINVCLESKKKLIIKPSIDSGGGYMIKVLDLEKSSKYDLTNNLKSLFKAYKKDFIVQEFLEQSSKMAKLNPTSLNTIRVMSYLSEDTVQNISSVLRVGQLGNFTDNFSQGGIACGINESGKLKEVGYKKTGGSLTVLQSGVILKDFTIPNFNNVLATVKELHKKVPYFRIISWDIGLNSKDNPVLIEYNTYRQSTKIHQVANGPLFGDFTDEILSLARD